MWPGHPASCGTWSLRDQGEDSPLPSSLPGAKLEPETRVGRHNLKTSETFDSVQFTDPLLRYFNKPPAPLRGSPHPYSRLRSDSNVLCCIDISGRNDKTQIITTKSTWCPLTHRRRGGKCMFNSLAYNCDYKDAIGKIQFHSRKNFNIWKFFQGQWMRHLIGAPPAQADNTEDAWLLKTVLPLLCLKFSLYLTIFLAFLFL